MVYYQVKDAIKADECNHKGFNEGTRIIRINPVLILWYCLKVANGFNPLELIFVYSGKFVNGR